MMQPPLPSPLALTLQLSERTLRLACLLLALAVTLGASLAAPQLLQSWEARIASQAWVMAPEQTPEQRIVVVAIDEKSLAELGAWPWPRDTLARLAERLGEDGAALQLYDIVLPEARSGDTRLAEALAHHPAVLAQVPQLGGGTPLRAGTLGDALPGMRCQAPIPATPHFLGNHAAFGGLPKGHIAPHHDADGMIRHQPPLVCVDGHVYPSLALRGLLHLTAPEGLARGALELQRGTGWLAPEWRLEPAALPELAVPLDAAGNMRIPFHQDPGAFTVIPAVDVLQQRHDPAWLEGAIVLVGATAFGLGDVVHTPHSTHTPGVELQARMLSGLLDQRIPHTPRQQPWLFAGVMLLSALLLYALAARPGRGSFIGLPLAAAGVPLLLLAGHALALLKADLWLGWLLPSLYAMLAGGLLLIVEYARTRMERLRLYTNLSSYLPQPLAHQIAYRQPSGAVEARREPLIVLCADLRNYSALQDALEPEEAAGLLHGFLVEATAIIEAQGGSVYAFQGDAVIATWPQGSAEAQRALAAGREMLTHAARFLPPSVPSGLAPLGLGVGLEQGSALVGSIGPARRRHHTLLGRPLALALRIQSMTAELGQPLLVGEALAHTLAAHTELEDQGRYLLEGVREPQRLYALPASQMPEPPGLEPALDSAEADGAAGVHLKLVK